jgi:hypothetical protein
MLMSAPPWIRPVVAAALAGQEPRTDAPNLLGNDGPVVVVRIDQQRLYLWEAGRVSAVYPVSTAARGVGNREGSLQTPLGLHRVAHKIGEGAALGTIFRGRIATGEIAPILSAPEATSHCDHVTSRILWLEGLEPGHNQGGTVDSFARYIYIHGTAEEGRIGTPASHGCVRMRNQDVIDLFARVPVHTPVVILHRAE